jgi:hypothetical protein
MERLTAAISHQVSVPALAAEGDCGAHKEFFGELVSRDNE